MSVVATDAQGTHAAGGCSGCLTVTAPSPATATVRLNKPTSNLFRSRAKSTTKGLDTSGLTGVISVDPNARTADVAGMCTYEDLVAATLPHGLSPPGGAAAQDHHPRRRVTGLGIESASFRNGLPHESVLELDILTGAGDIVTASRTQYPPDLFHAFPNSYGTLGYSVRLKIELESVKPFVSLRHLRFHTIEHLIAAMERIIETGGYDGAPVDYLDGGGVQRAGELPVPRSTDRDAGGAGQRLHRPADLLPLHSAPRG